LPAPRISDRNLELNFVRQSLWYSNPAPPVWRERVSRGLDAREVDAFAPSTRQPPSTSLKVLRNPSSAVPEDFEDSPRRSYDLRASGPRRS
jgi:hypothetical protein